MNEFEKARADIKRVRQEAEEKKIEKQLEVKNKQLKEEREGKRREEEERTVKGLLEQGFAVIKEIAPEILREANQQIFENKAQIKNWHKTIFSHNHEYSYTSGMGINEDYHVDTTTHKGSAMTTVLEIPEIGQISLFTLINLEYDRSWMSARSPWKVAENIRDFQAGELPNKLSLFVSEGQLKQRRCPYYPSINVLGKTSEEAKSELREMVSEKIVYLHKQVLSSH